MVEWRIAPAAAMPTAVLTSSHVSWCAQYGKGKGELGSKSRPIVLDVEGKGAKSMSQNPLFWSHTEQTQQFEKVRFGGPRGACLSCSRTLLRLQGASPGRELPSGGPLQGMREHGKACPRMCLGPRTGV